MALFNKDKRVMALLKDKRVMALFNKEGDGSAKQG